MRPALLSAPLCLLSMPVSTEKTCDSMGPCTLTIAYYAAS